MAMRKRGVSARAAAAAWLLAALGSAAGCGPPRMEVRPLRYDVEVRLDPDRSMLEGQVVLDLQQRDGSPPVESKAKLELLLHPGLELEEVELEGATIRKQRRRRGRTGEDGEVVPSRHRLIVQRPADQLRLRLAWSGRLLQDVEAGEKEGEIHNFAVSAHVGSDGIFLEPGGYWYPRVSGPEGGDPAWNLADYELRMPAVEGFEMVAGLERDGVDAGGRLRWRSPFPLEGLVLLGGPLQRWSRRHGEIELHAVLAPGKDAVAADILDAAAEYLDRYQELIGRYPFREFTVLEAFFSSGFAFPTCTQIAGSQLSEYKQYRRHGYLDHELLHNWWGNGVFVDPQNGNWCEGLCAYLGNYYGHVLDGDESGARKQRRNQSNFLSGVEPEEDKPLGTFGLGGGAGRGIGYNKGAAVFHMLERTIGADALFAGLERLTAERLGTFATWDDLQAAFEQASGRDLDGFFEQWVRRGGAPELHLEDAHWEPGSDRLRVTLSQGETDFRLEVPLRLHYGDEREDVVAILEQRVDEVEIPCRPQDLTAVELDPDYHLFRKLKPEEVMPTSSLTRHAKKLLVVVPEGELAEGYHAVLEQYRRAVAGEDGEPAGGDVAVRPVGALAPEELGRGSVLILGDAVRDAVVREFLSRTPSPVEWAASGFLLEGEEYADAGQAVFLTVHHPGRAGAGVTVYYGNSPAALANARLLSYYPNSLLVFQTAETEGVEAGGETPRTEVIRRMDFEFHERIDFR